MQKQKQINISKDKVIRNWWSKRDKTLTKRRNAYQTDDQKEARPANRRKAYETDDQKQTRLGKGKERNGTLLKCLVVLALEH